MGRAARKSASSAEPREHWTDTHPDRDMWSPGRLAIARTQTQEEYEALYGRGQAVDHKDEQPLHGSLFIPSADAEVIRDMQERRWSQAEVLSFLAKAHQSGGIRFKDLEPNDPFIDALWEQQWQATTEALQKMGASETLAMLEDNKAIARSAWGERFLRELEEQIDTGSSIEPSISLYSDLLEGRTAWEIGMENNEYRKLQAEVVTRMADWAESDFDSFSEFAKNTLAPAICEMKPSWAQYVDSREDVVRLSGHVADAILEKSDRFHEMLAHLEDSGYFQGSTNSVSWSGEMMWRLAYTQFSAECQSIGEWPPDEEEWEGIELRSVRSGFKGLYSTGALEFLASDLGQQIGAELHIQNSKELEGIAKHFDDDIILMYLSGRINLLDAWRQARDKRDGV